jgi:hypothetical protein
MTRPDHRTLQAAYTLEQLAPDVTAALTNLHRERAICDGYTAGIGSGRGTSDSSTTEAAALQADRLDTRAQRIRNTIADIERDIHHLSRLTRDSLGLRAPVTIARCRDNHTGRQGAIEWGDPTCENLPDKAGLCVACYHRERRWRQAHGLPAREIEPAA